MGRKTFQSIGRPLPGRDDRSSSRATRVSRAEGVDVARDIDAALRLAEARRARRGAEEIIVAGGGEIYAQTIARAGRLYITEVDLAPEGDAHFPPIDPALWREVRREPARAARATKRISRSWTTAEVWRSRGDMRGA